MASVDRVLIQQRDCLTTGGRTSLTVKWSFWKTHLNLKWRRQTYWTQWAPLFFYLYCRAQMHIDGTTMYPELHVQATKRCYIRIAFLSAPKSLEARKRMHSGAEKSFYRQERFGGFHRQGARQCHWSGTPWSSSQALCFWRYYKKKSLEKQQTIM